MSTILARFSLLGGLVWVLGSGLRARTTEAERDRLVLGEEVGEAG